MALGRSPEEIVNSGNHQLLKISAKWNRCYLKDVAVVQNGCAFSTKYFSKTEGLPLIRIRDIKRIETTDKYFGAYDDEYLVHKGDILVGMDGDFKVAHWQGEIALLNQRVCRIFPKNIHPKFLFYCLQPYLDAIHEETSAVTVKHLSSKTIESIPLPFPDIDTQEAIAAKIDELFSELDKAQEQLETALQQLKVYRQAVLKWAFEGRLTKKNVKEGELPEGWKEVLLKDICSLVGGVTKGRDLGGKATINLPYLRVANVQDGYLDLKEIKFIEVLESDLEKYRLIKGDILYTEGGDKDKLGRGTLWNNEVKDCIHQNHVFRARIKTDNAISGYVALFSQSPNARTYFYNHAKQTTNLASINISILSNLTIPIPPLNEQFEILHKLESILSNCAKVESETIITLDRIKALRQSILKQAFEGKLI